MIEKQSIKLICQIKNSLGSFGLICLFLLIILPTPTLVLANLSTPSPSPDPVQQKLQELQAEIASKAAAMKKQVAQQIQNKAYIGKVVTIDKKNNLITIVNPKGDQQVMVAEDTVYTDATGKVADRYFFLPSIRTNDTIATLGEVDDKNILHAKKVIRTDPLEENTDTPYSGTLISVNTGLIIIKGKNNTKLALNLNGNTIIRYGNDEDAPLSAIKVGDFLAAVADPGKKQSSRLYNEETTAKFIYVFGHPASSPSPTATPSASTKP